MDSWKDDEFEKDLPQDIDLEELGGDQEDTCPCPHCGQEIYEQAERCLHCGQYVTSEQQEQRQDSWGSLLWTFVGIMAILVLLHVVC